MENGRHPSGHDVVVGASAVGVEPLKAMVKHLPPNLPAPVVVVLNIPPVGTSFRRGILERAGPLRAAHAVHGDAIERSVVYIAPADQHVRFADGQVQLDRGPKENGHRPAVDPLFRSAASDKPTLPPPIGMRGFTHESLLLEQSAHVERPLWPALRALEEKAAILRRMSARASDRGARSSAAGFACSAEAVVDEAVVLRGLLHGLDAAPSEEATSEEETDDAETVA